MPARHFDERIARIAAPRHGVFSLDQALRLGATRSMITVRLRSGRWRRMHRGVYAISGAPETWSARVIAACLATGGWATRRTAGAVWELPGCTQGPIEVVVPATRHPRCPGVVVHRATDLGGDDTTTRGPIRVVRVPYALLWLAADLPPDDVEEAVEDAIRRRLVIPARLRRRLETVRPNHPGIGVLREIMDRRGDQPATGSGLETELMQLVRQVGGPELVRQHRVVLPSGPVYLDLCCPEAKTYLESDGWKWHGSRSRAYRDKERQNELAELGWMPLRFTSEHIRDRPEATAQRVVRTLRARGHRW